MSILFFLVLIIQDRLLTYLQERELVLPLVSLRSERDKNLRNPPDRLRVVERGLPLVGGRLEGREEPGGGSRAR